ncbi:MAG: hypothetical protein AAF492_05945, partial [Verrucomicrobiota bacterium]
MFRVRLGPTAKHKYGGVPEVRIKEEAMIADLYTTIARVILSGAIMMGPSFGEALPVPEFSEIKGLLGRETSGLAEFLKKHQLESIAIVETEEKHGPEFKFVTKKREIIYGRWTFPVRVKTRIRLIDKSRKQTDAKEALECVILTIKSASRSVRNYPGTLPFGLKRGDSPEIVRKKLGRPEGQMFSEDGNGYMNYIAGAGSARPISIKFW